MKGGFNMKTGRSLCLLAVAGSAFLFSACTVKHEAPSQTFMPNMAYTTVYKAQEGQFGMPNNSVRVPVKGTIPRGFEPYAFAGDYAVHALKAARQKNPLPMDRDTLYLGKAKFNIYCAACHGQDGQGNTPVIEAGYPRPTSLTSKNAMARTDGDLFHIMTVGYSNMPAYQTQIAPNDRWAIARYIRALQRSQNPSASDLEEAKKW